MPKAKNPILTELHKTSEGRFAVRVKARENSYSGFIYEGESLDGLRSKVEGKYPGKFSDKDWDGLIVELMEENDDLQEEIDSLNMEISRLNEKVDAADFYS